MVEIKYFKKTCLEKAEIMDVLRDSFIKDEKVVIKLHFGEPGNKTAFKPEDIRPYIEALKELAFDTLMIDTPVAYDSPRGTKKGYERVIKERGYDVLGEYVVSDRYTKSDIGGYTFEVAKELAEAKNVLVISHVKGHECAGFGGAIKNLGMGALSKVSKAFIHDGSKPLIDKDKCIGCGLCSRLCPAKAIAMEDSKAEPNLNLCWGCSICEINCPTGALTPKKDVFDKLLALGAMSAVNLMPKNTFYFNIIKNVTKSCDCEEDSGDIIASDIGTLFGPNPVAVDCASIDLINEKEGKDIFLEANNKDPRLQVNYAQEISGLSSRYKLVEI